VTTLINLEGGAMSDGAVIVLIPLYFVTLLFATFIGLILWEILKTLRKIHSGLEKNASLLVETNKRIAGSAARLDSANSKGTNVLAARVRPTTAPEKDKKSKQVQGIQALLDRLAEGIAQTRTATHPAGGSR
jgi:hypothetical protein